MSFFFTYRLVSLDMKRYIFLFIYLFLANFAFDEPSFVSHIIAENLGFKLLPKQTKELYNWQNLSGLLKFRNLNLKFQNYLYKKLKAGLYLFKSNTAGLLKKPFYLS